MCIIQCVFYVAPIEVKGKDKTLLYNKHEKRSYSSENQNSGSYRPSTPWDPTTVRPGVPSEGTLLNVYTIKDKP